MIGANCTASGDSSTLLTFPGSRGELTDWQQARIVQHYRDEDALKLYQRAHPRAKGRQAPSERNLASEWLAGAEFDCLLLVEIGWDFANVVCTFRNGTHFSIDRGGTRVTWRDDDPGPSAPACSCSRERQRQLEIDNELRRQHILGELHYERRRAM